MTQRYFSSETNLVTVTWLQVKDDILFSHGTEYLVDPASPATSAPIEGYSEMSISEHATAKTDRKTAHIKNVKAAIAITNKFHKKLDEIVNSLPIIARA